jgi:hypothetical protein
VSSQGVGEGHQLGLEAAHGPLDGLDLQAGLLDEGHHLLPAVGLSEDEGVADAAQDPVGVAESGLGEVTYIAQSLQNRLKLLPVLPEPGRPADHLRSYLQPDHWCVLQRCGVACGSTTAHRSAPAEPGGQRLKAPGRVGAGCPPDRGSRSKLS